LEPFPVVLGQGAELLLRFSLSVLRHLGKLKVNNENDLQIMNQDMIDTIFFMQDYFEDILYPESLSDDMLGE